MGVLVSGYPFHLSWMLLSPFVPDFVSSLGGCSVCWKLPRPICSLLLAQPVRNSLTS